MASLSFRTALAEIEQALVLVLRLALLQRETVADVDALRAFSVLGASGTPSVKEGQPIFMTATGLNWQWRRASVADDDGFAVIRPTAVATADPGRWHATTSTSSSGYLISVNYWQGETRQDELRARFYAERPSIAVVWESSQNKARSTVPGAIYDYTAGFSVWCIDENLRPDSEVFLGSGYASDSGHPGVIAIVGDVKKALADCNKQVRNVLGLGGGVKVIELGDENMEDADLAERVMVMSVGVTVHASVENPDNEASEHQAITSVYGQPALTSLGEQDTFDASNYVVSGLLVLPQLGLTATPSSGSVVIDGATVAVTPSSHTFTAYLDTYLDVAADGSITYVESPTSAPAPAVTAGCLRTTRITTDGAGVVSCDNVAARSATVGAPNLLLP